MGKIVAHLTRRGKAPNGTARGHSCPQQCPHGPRLRNRQWAKNGSTLLRTNPRAPELSAHSSPPASKVGSLQWRSALPSAPPRPIPPLPQYDLLKLIRRNLRYHARGHFGVVLGAAIGSAALFGALVVGDSVRESLTQMALRGLGMLHFALATQDPYRRRASNAVGESFEWGKSKESKKNPYQHSYASWGQTSALVLPGIVARQDGTARANSVTVLGVDDVWWPLLADWGDLMFQGRESPHARWKDGGVAFISQALARQLAAREGDQIVLRVRKSSALALDAAISPRNEDTVGIRLTVGKILPPAMLGDFNLTAGSTLPANLFFTAEVPIRKNRHPQRSQPPRHQRVVRGSESCSR